MLKTWAAAASQAPRSADPLGLKAQAPLLVCAVGRHVQLAATYGI